MKCILCKEEKLSESHLMFNCNKVSSESKQIIKVQEVLERKDYNIEQIAEICRYQRAGELAGDLRNIKRKLDERREEEKVLNKTKTRKIKQNKKKERKIVIKDHSKKDKKITEDIGHYWITDIGSDKLIL